MFETNRVCGIMHSVSFIFFKIVSNFSVYRKIFRKYKMHYSYHNLNLYNKLQPGLQLNYTPGSDIILVGKQIILATDLRNSVMFCH